MTEDATRRCCVCGAAGGKHCALCKSRVYCSRACQKQDWSDRDHKSQCASLAADHHDRVLEALFLPKSVKEAPAIVAGVAAGANGANGATNGASNALLPQRPCCAAPSSEAHDDTPAWRGTCAICLDSLPTGNRTQIFYSCCCKRLCMQCSDACHAHDARCPLCRTPAHESEAEWLSRLEKHVDRGHPEAQMMRADTYRSVVYKSQDDESALEETDASEKALKLYQLAAAQGHAGAQMQLGLSYHHGDGVAQSPETAASWYFQAAKQQYPHAQLYLGLLFFDGHGVQQSFEESVRWLHLAAAQGLPDAYYTLGVCYAQGKGVAKNDAEALIWFQRAAAEGDAEAADEVSQRLLEANEQRIEANDASAIQT
mmetsp:Transcript_17922/g.61577  ORF Transcript_17922/g.61577 Transcript_17922/m.61577 type:complete len:370 (+) Transcript_17922:68-1177(+)